MNCMQLRELTESDELAFNKAVQEFELLEPDWTFGFHYDRKRPFVEYVQLTNSWSRGENNGTFVPNSFLIAVVGDVIVGRVSLRHRLNDFLMWDEGGHIGYGVVPSQRRLGYATEMLRLALIKAKELSIDRVLITTDVGNSSSIKTIEKNGGVNEAERDPRVRSDKLRFWIEIS